MPEPPPIPSIAPPPPPFPMGGSNAPLPPPIPPKALPLTPPPPPVLDNISPMTSDVAAPPPVLQSKKQAPHVPSVPLLFDNKSKEPENKIEDTEKYEGPQILLEPLHILDPLCVKWGVGMGARFTHNAEVEEKSSKTGSTVQNSAPVFLSSPSPRTPSSKQASGYVRLMGLLSNGAPWDHNIPISDLNRTGGVAIGRDGSCCNVVLPEGSISRRHALLEYINNSVTVTDLNSTNGTGVNGQRLSSTEQRVTVNDGSILTLGNVTLRVEIQAPMLSPAPML